MVLMLMMMMFDVVAEVDQFLLVMFDYLVMLFVNLHHIDSFDFLVHIIVPKFLKKIKQNKKINQKKINEFDKEKKYPNI